MLSGTAIRPTDVITTAAGLTVEVTNPDAEGRLILADALWWARRDGATHLVDLATLTGAMRAGMGDMYAGVFANDDAWRDAVVDAGNASGDLAWPWPLHPRYRPLIDSTVADLRNTAGKSFGFPIVAATFLSSSRVRARGLMSDMLGTGVGRRAIAATRSAAAPPATASACSSSSPPAWRVAADGDRSTTAISAAGQLAESRRVPDLHTSVDDLFSSGSAKANSGAALAGSEHPGQEALVQAPHRSARRCTACRRPVT